MALDWISETPYDYILTLTLLAEISDNLQSKRTRIESEMKLMKKRPQSSPIVACISIRALSISGSEYNRNFLLYIGMMV